MAWSSVRTRSDKDKRVVYLTLTERGKAAYEHHKRFHEQMIANAKANLSEEELDILVRSLRQLNDYFRTAYS